MTQVTTWLESRRTPPFCEQCGAVAEEVARLPVIPTKPYRDVAIIREAANRVLAIPPSLGRSMERMVSMAAGSWTHGF